jgi:hypothetical protein
VVDTRDNTHFSQYAVFERLLQDKQSYYEWRLLYLFAEEDLKEGIKDLLEEQNETN